MLSVGIARVFLTFDFLNKCFFFFDLAFPNKNKTLRRKSNFSANIMLTKVVFKTPLTLMLVKLSQF